MIVHFLIQFFVFLSIIGLITCQQSASGKLIPIVSGQISSAAMTFLGNGDLVSCWIQNNEISCQLSGPTGQPTGTPWQINGFSNTGISPNLQVGQNNQAEFIVTWEQIVNSNWEVFMTSYLNNGTQQRSPQNVQNNAEHHKAYSQPYISRGGYHFYMVSTNSPRQIQVCGEGPWQGENMGNYDYFGKTATNFQVYEPLYQSEFAICYALSGGQMELASSVDGGQPGYNQPGGFKNISTPCLKTLILNNTEILVFYLQQSSQYELAADLYSFGLQYLRTITFISSSSSILNPQPIIPANNAKQFSIVYTNGEGQLIENTYNVTNFELESSLILNNSTSNYEEVVVLALPNGNIGVGITSSTDFAFTQFNPNTGKNLCSASIGCNSNYETCNSNLEVCQCSNYEGCNILYPYCNTGTGLCQKCLNNEECPPQTECDLTNGECNFPQLNPSLETYTSGITTTMVVAAVIIMATPDAPPSQGFTIISIFQQFFYLTYLAVVYPNQLLQFLNIFEKGLFTWFPNLTKPPSTSKYDLPSPHNIYIHGHTGYFFQTGGTGFSILILAIALWMLTKILERITKNQKHVTKAKDLIEWGFVTRLWLIFNVPLVYASILQLYQINFTNGSLGIASIFSLVLIPASFFFIYPCYKIIQTNYKPEKFPFLYVDFKDKGVARYSSLIYYIRRLIEPLIIVICYPVPGLQVGLLFLVSCYFSFFLITVKPRKERTDNYFEILFNVSLSFVYGMFYQFIQYAEGRDTQLGNACIGIILSVLTIQFLLTIYNLIHIVREKIRKFKEEKNEKAKMEKENERGREMQETEKGIEKITLEQNAQDGHPITKLEDLMLIMSDEYTAQQKNLENQPHSRNRSRISSNQIDMIVKRLSQNEGEEKNEMSSLICSVSQEDGFTIPIPETHEKKDLTKSDLYDDQ